MLIENGADVNIKSDNGKTALKYAMKYNKKKIVSLLRQAGAK